MNIIIPKMDLSWIPVKIECECCGADASLRDGRRFCSNKCRQKWNYHNNPQMRKKQIERARKRVESIREGERVKKKKEVVNKILDQYKEDNNGLIDLYKKIYSK